MIETDNEMQDWYGEMRYEFSNEFETTNYTTRNKLNNNIGTYIRNKKS